MSALSTARSTAVLIAPTIANRMICLMGLVLDEESSNHRNIRQVGLCRSGLLPTMEDREDQNMVFSTEAQRSEAATKTCSPRRHGAHGEDQKWGGNSPLPLWPSCSTQGFFVFSVPPW